MALSIVNENIPLDPKKSNQAIKIIHKEYKYLAILTELNVTHAWYGSTGTIVFKIITPVLKYASKKDKKYRVFDKDGSVLKQIDWIDDYF